MRCETGKGGGVKELLVRSVSVVVVGSVETRLRPAVSYGGR